MVRLKEPGFMSFKYQSIHTAPPLHTCLPIFVAAKEIKRCLKSLGPRYLVIKPISIKFLLIYSQGYLRNNMRNFRLNTVMQLPAYLVHEGDDIAISNNKIVWLIRLSIF